MTTFSFSTGNPANLTGGTTANMSDISGSLTDLRTFLNGANLDATNIAPVADTLLASPTNAVWRTVMQLDYRAGVTGLTTTPTYMGGTAIIQSGTAASAASGVWTPPTASDIAVAGKTTRMRIRVSWLTNATPPGITLTWGLYPITGVAGGAGAITVTLGAVVAGTTAVLTTPVSGSSGEAKSASFDFSAITGATTYALGLVGSGAQAVNSMVGAEAFFEMRHT